MLNEAQYFSGNECNKICEVCPHRCNISFGEQICESRFNNKIIGGVVRSLAEHPLMFYEDNPEKIKMYTIGFLGCNLACKTCINHRFSCGPQNKLNSLGLDLSPEEIISDIPEGINYISYGYTEPLIHPEKLISIMKFANRMRLKNIIKSNGYINKNIVQNIIPYVDAINIDVKGSNNFYKNVCGSKDDALDVIFDIIKMFVKKHKHVEITHMIIPNINNIDDIIYDISQRIIDTGENIPVIVTKYLRINNDKYVSPTNNDLENVKRMYNKYGIKVIRRV